MIPVDPSPDAILAVTRWCQAVPKVELYVEREYDWGKSQKDPDLYTPNGKPTEIHKHEVLQTAVQTKWAKRPSKSTGMKKVSLCLSVPIFGRYTTSGTGPDVYNIPVRSKKEGMILESIIQSEFFQFAFRMMLYSGRYPRTMFALIPAMDLTRTWTDEQIYEYFNIPQKVRTFIKSWTQK